jgi:hypothetical protein
MTLTVSAAIFTPREPSTKEAAHSASKATYSHIAPANIRVAIIVVTHVAAAFVNLGMQRQA